MAVDADVVPFDTSPAAPAGPPRRRRRPEPDPSRHPASGATSASVSRADQLRAQLAELEAQEAQAAARARMAPTLPVDQPGASLLDDDDETEWGGPVWADEVEPPTRPESSPVVDDDDVEVEGEVMAAPAAPTTAVEVFRPDPYSHLTTAEYRDRVVVRPAYAAVGRAARPIIWTVFAAITLAFVALLVFAVLGVITGGAA